MMTGILYLSRCSGGETQFYANEQIEKTLEEIRGRLTGDAKHVLYSVHPEPGRFLFFWQNLMHEGCPPGEGEKYIIRSDLFFERKPKIFDSEKDREAFDYYLKALTLGDKNLCKEANHYFNKARRTSENIRKLYRLC